MTGWIFIHLHTIGAKKGIRTLQMILNRDDSRLVSFPKTIPKSQASSNTDTHKIFKLLLLLFLFTNNCFKTTFADLFRKSFP